MAFTLEPIWQKQPLGSWALAAAERDELEAEASTLSSLVLPTSVARGSVELLFRKPSLDVLPHSDGLETRCIVPDVLNTPYNSFITVTGIGFSGLHGPKLFDVWSITARLSSMISPRWHFHLIETTSCISTEFENGKKIAGSKWQQERGWKSLRANKSLS